MKQRLRNRIILGIDPGDTESGYCLVDSNLKPVEKGIIDNNLLLKKLYENDFQIMPTHVAIEMVASYGMGVGRHIFDTCVWIGRFYEAVKHIAEPEFIFRRYEKICLCGCMQAKDSNIRIALVDRFTPGEKNYGKGCKKKPGWFYGFTSDVWAAYAVVVTYSDILDGIYLPT